MKRGIFSLRRLRWKLTFTYTLVTVVALLALELLVVSAVVAFLNSNLPPTLAAQQIRDDLAPRLETHLQETPPDADGLRQELADFTGGAEVREAGARREDPTSFELGPGGGSLFVIDEEQRLLVSTPELQDFPEGKRFDADRIDGLDPLVDAALGGEESSRRLSTNTGERMLTVVPLEDGDGRVSGALVGTVRMPNLTGALLIGVGISAVLLMLPAALLGTLFGFVTAWGLTRRLRRLARAAQRWSGGDFSVNVEDRSKDELGQLSRELNTMAAQLETLMQTRGELATLETRNRFARDLHDSVKQQVFATSLQVAAARALIQKDREAAEAHLVQAEKLVRGTQKELNVLIHEMRPAALEGKGLASALREYAAAGSRGSEIPAEIRVQGERETPLEVEQALFRVAQEALANVAKHSAAKGAEVDLDYDPDALTLRVSDDGRGFHPGKASEGFGLRSMGSGWRGSAGTSTSRALRGRGRALSAFVLWERREERGEKMGEAVTVLLVDDHELVRRGVRAFLETQLGISVVAEAGSGEEAVKLAAEHAPDVALMDLIMPGGIDGVEATRRLRAISPRTNVVVLTSYHDDEHVFPAIRAGALSYVLKEVGPKELADAVRKAAVGEAILHPRVAARMVREIHGARGTQPNVFQDLSERELEVLKLIADGLSNAEISGRLYISEKTTKSHVSNILGKLHLADRTQAAVYAWRQGVVRRY